MPKLSVSRHISRRVPVAGAAAVLAAAGLAAVPQASVAKTSQTVIIQDGQDLSNPNGTLAQFRALGATTVRVIVPWSSIAPKPNSTKKPSFNATDPNAYPKSNWGPYDGIVRAAQKYNLQVDFTVTGGAPVWAEGKNIPKAGTQDKFFAWEPNDQDYGQFMQAVGTRYDGSFTPSGTTTPLPAVRFWVIFNEPNFGEDLGPQAIDDSRVLIAPMLYRGLIDAGWSALQKNHRGQTILWGDFAARGFYLSYGPRGRGAPQGYPGNYGQTRPGYFLRYLYCVGGNYRRLTGSAAKSVGCPTSGSAAAFRKAHPALFSATGVGVHPYPLNGTPVNDGRVKDYATFPELGSFAGNLDRSVRAWGSGKKFGIYDDEYGYITNPPNRQLVSNPPTSGRHPYLSASTAAYYINWAEYLSWRNPRIQSYMQYLLRDPGANAGAYAGFASGLENANGTHKATYDAFRLPVYMPKTSIRRGSKATVWGAARPAPFQSGAQTVSIQ
ncbi:MAG: hypothetical protein JOZ07_06550, partial [Solirubrobacterales bacterium]|nr:hypothetical protein [Solirubrobacterales bacterium]